MEKTPLDDICDEIRRALDSGFYYLALSVSLSLPDICVSLGCDPDRIHVKSGEYIEWVRDNLAGRINLTSEEIYGLRCGVLHNARLKHDKLSAYRQIAFTLPNENIKIGQIIVKRRDENGLQAKYTSLDLVNFCGQIMAAVTEWVNNHKDEPNVKANLPGVMRYRPEGLSPIVGGLPVIA